VRVIPFGKAAKACIEVLRDNQMLALLGDRDFTKEAGIVVDFFGRKTFLPKGPAAFALKTRAAIVPGFMIRNPDDTFVLKIEKPLEYSVDETAEGLTKKIGALLERYIRQYPDQWFMFRRFWVE
jgi:KDO2-lipid IV(A) lauroyltransferase